MEQRAGYLKRLIKLINFQQDWQKKKKNPSKIKEKIQITNIKNKIGSNISDLEINKKIIMKQYKLYIYTSDNSDEMG